MVGLVPLSFADMKREWSTTVHAHGEFFIGYRVVVARAASENVLLAGRQRKRFRFRDSHASALRLSSPRMKESATDRFDDGHLHSWLSAQTLDQGKT